MKTPPFEFLPDHQKLKRHHQHLDVKVLGNCLEFELSVGLRRLQSSVKKSPPGWYFVVQTPS